MWKCPRRYEVFCDDVNVCENISFPSTSPSQGLCCGQNCEFKPLGQQCDEETDCVKESVCSGLSPLCPKPDPKENLTVCSQGTRVCLNGVRLNHTSNCDSTHFFRYSTNQAALGSVQQSCKAGLQRQMLNLWSCNTGGGKKQNILHILMLPGSGRLPMYVRL